MNKNQLSFLETLPRNQYRCLLTATLNNKGVLDVDTIKGCSLGLNKYPSGGCYDECYAYKIAKRYGIEYSISVPRMLTLRNLWHIYSFIKNSALLWYRVGVMGDPCHSWEHTISTCNALRFTSKIPIIITKHWIPLTNEQISRLIILRAIINTSVSGMDSDKELLFRVSQFKRLKDAGIHSILRIVSCNYGETNWGKNCKDKQEYLYSFNPIIDNPFRLSVNNKHYLNGDIIATTRKDSIGGGKLVSLLKQSTYLGKCNNCPDQCGMNL